MENSDSLIVRYYGKWKIEEQTRRRQLTGTAVGFDTVAFGGGFLQESGKKHHLVVAYVDENGIPQEPRFGVFSLSGNAIKEWAAKVYDAVVSFKSTQEYAIHETTDGTLSGALGAMQSSIPSSVNEKSQAVDSQDTSLSQDAIQILKIRFARGEITKDEFEEMRKIIES